MAGKWLGDVTTADEARHKPDYPLGRLINIDWCAAEDGPRFAMCDMPVHQGEHHWISRGSPEAKAIERARRVQRMIA